MADPVEIDIRLRDEGTDCSRPKEGIRTRQWLVQNSSTVSSVSFALAIHRTRLTRPEWEHLQCALQFRVITRRLEVPPLVHVFENSHNDILDSGLGFLNDRSIQRVARRPEFRSIQPPRQVRGPLGRKSDRWRSACRP